MTAAIEQVRWALGLVDDSTTRLVEDLRDAPLTRAAAGGNHPLWIVGHLAVIEPSPEQDSVVGNRLAG